MEQNRLAAFSEKAKTELQRLFDQGAFRPLLDLLEEEYRLGEAAGSHYEIHIYGHCLAGGEKRLMVPLAVIAPGRNPEGAFAGVGFGLIPSLPGDVELRLEVVSKDSS